MQKALGRLIRATHVEGMRCGHLVSRFGPTAIVVDKDGGNHPWSAHSSKGELY